MNPSRHCRTRTTRRSTLPAAVLAVMVLACETPAPPRAAPPGPPVVPIAASQSVVMRACRQTEDFVTDASRVGGPTEIATDVTVTIYPRLESSGNTMSQLASGNIIARIVKTGSAPYRRWGLGVDADTSCWMVGQRPNQPAVSRFVSSTIDTSNGDFAIQFHREDHARDSAAIVRSISRVPGASVVRITRVTLAGLIRLPLPGRPVVLQDTTGGGGHAWSTCITNGCCMAGF